MRRYRVEPYVAAADVYSGAEHGGRGGWTWYTGAAAWLWRLGVEAILGLKLVGGDLVVQPCIPASWDGYRATVRRPGGSCEIVVHNPGRGHGTGAAATRLHPGGAWASCPCGGLEAVAVSSCWVLTLHIDSA